MCRPLKMGWKHRQNLDLEITGSAHSHCLCQAAKRKSSMAGVRENVGYIRPWCKMHEPPFMDRSAAEIPHHKVAPSRQKTDIKGWNIQQSGRKRKLLLETCKPSIFLASISVLCFPECIIRWVCMCQDECYSYLLFFLTSFNLPLSNNVQHRDVRAALM